MVRPVRWIFLRIGTDIECGSVIRDRRHHTYVFQTEGLFVRQEGFDLRFVAVLVVVLGVEDLLYTIIPIQLIEVGDFADCKTLDIQNLVDGLRQVSHQFGSSAGDRRSSTCDTHCGIKQTETGIGLT